MGTTLVVLLYKQRWSYVLLALGFFGINVLLVAVILCVRQAPLSVSEPSAAKELFDVSWPTRCSSSPRCCLMSWARDRRTVPLPSLHAPSCLVFCN